MPKGPFKLRIDYEGERIHKKRCKDLDEAKETLESLKAKFR